MLKIALRTKFHLNKVAHLNGHRASVYAVAMGFGAHTIISGSGDGWIVNWDLRKPTEGKLIAKVEGQIFSLHAIQGKHIIVAGTYAGNVHFIDLKNKSNLPAGQAGVKIYPHHPNGVFAIFQIGENIFTGGGDGVLTKWTPDFKPLESIKLSHSNLRSIDYSVARNEIVIGCSDTQIYFVNPETMKLTGRIKEAHENSVFIAKYLNEDMILSGGRDAQLKAWSLGDSVKCESTQSAHWFTINDIAINHQKRIFVTASRDKTMRIWDADDFKLLKVIDKEKNEGHVNSVNKLLWSNYKDYLISASDDRSLAVWTFNASEV